MTSGTYKIEYLLNGANQWSHGGQSAGLANAINMAKNFRKNSGLNPTSVRVVDAYDGSLQWME